MLSGNRENTVPDHDPATTSPLVQYAFGESGKYSTGPRSRNYQSSGSVCFRGIGKIQHRTTIPQLPVLWFSMLSGNRENTAPDHDPATTSPLVQYAFGESGKYS